MNKNLRFLIVLTFVSFAALNFSFVSSSATFSSYTNGFQTNTPTLQNYYGMSSTDYWPILTRLQNDECSSLSTDFIVAIPVGGCDPAVVRSDLLAEQNVPVFCKLTAIRINPLIDVSTISSISFSGDLPEGVAGISYHPADSAIKNYNTVVSDAVEKDIGSVVITLKRQPVEEDMEKFVSGILTANIRYNSKLAYGVGTADFYLDEMDDTEWSKRFVDYSFWAKKGYLRAESIDGNSAKINVLLDENKLYSSLNLREGETSQTIYYPGYYCTVGFKVKLNSITDKSDMALISVNDDIYWVKEGSTIGDTGCRVRNLNVLADGSGEMKIYCTGTNNFDLSIKSTGITLSNSSEDTKGGMVVGDYIIEEGKRWYLGYYKRASSEGFGNFAVVFNLTRNPSKEELSLINSVCEGASDKNILSTALDGIRSNEGKESYKDSYEIIELGGKGSLSNITFVGYPSLQEVSNSVLQDSYATNLSEGTQVVKYLTETYPYEDKGNGEFWGEEALFEQIQLAKRMNNNSLLDELTEDFVRLYPESKLYREVLEIQRTIGIKNYDRSMKSVFLNNQFYEFSVDRFVSGLDYEKEAKIRFEGVEKTVKMHEVYNIHGNKWKEGDGIAQVRITNIQKDSVSVQYYYSKDKKPYSRTIKIGESEVFAKGTDYSLEIGVSDCIVETVAHVSIIPEIKNKQTQSNFSFGFPIEQRMIPLTPEAALKNAENINSTLESLRNFNEDLKKTITVLNGACTAYSGYVMGMNFLSGLSGEATARTIVNNYYKDYCKKEYPDDSLIECYEAEEVEGVVQEVAEAIKKVNNNITSIRKQTEGQIDFFGNVKITDIDGFIKSIMGNFSDFSSGNITLDGMVINFSNLTTTEQVRAALLHHELGCTDSSGSSKVCNVSRRNLEIELAGARIAESRKELVKKYGVTVEEYYSWSGRNERIPISVVGNSQSKYIGGITLSENNYFKVIEYQSSVYLLNFSKDAQGNFNLTNLYRWNNSKFIDVFENDRNIFNNIGVYQPATSGCKNYYKNPEVRYYSSGYAQGRPAVVPIDVVNGWYASILPSKGVGYDDSGYVNSFYICNVGPDGEMNLRSQDDAGYCFEYSTSNPHFFDGRICDLSVSEQRSLYNKATKYIQMALSSKDGIVLDDGKTIKSGTNVSGSSDLDCLDYMSAKDCKTLYNLCDPVVCPSSRCDYNGKYVVEDVTSTGIIGGLTLCWHNSILAGGDVIIPFCLTGIYSGLENTIAMLEQYQACLLRRAETGEYTGACDAITALYWCNFVWENAPLLGESILPNLFDLRKGSGGGGEYLTGEDSVKKVKETAAFFTDYYAKNIFDSFKLDQDLQYPTSICSIDDFLVSGNISSDFSSLARSFFEPESSSQAYAYFTESSYTTQTSPPTSHYKVYYQIYAGNRYTQTTYRVYLKKSAQNYLHPNLPERIMLETETLRQGESVSESKDFTAPSGYSELCISLNDKEYCGFGSTGSSFLGDLASDQYVKAQLDKNIKTTAECQSARLGINDISSTGITRICSSQSPSIGMTTENKVYCTVNGDCDSYYKCEAEVTDSNIKVCYNKTLGGAQVYNSNWVDAGYCDNPSIRCWVDRQSVDSALRTMNLSDIEDVLRSTDNLKKMEEIYKTVSEELDSVKTEIEKLNVSSLNLEIINPLISQLKNISGYDPNSDGILGKGTNEHKARALAYEASLYRLMIQSLVVEGAERYTVKPEPETSKTEDTNDSTNNDVRVGENPVEEVIVTQGNSEEPGASSSNIYIVQLGDTFSEIASKNSLSIPQLKDLNPGITDIHTIYVGQKINVSPAK